MISEETLKESEMKRIILVILSLIVYLGARKLVPSDFHPLASAISLVGLLWASFSLGKSFTLALIGTALGLSGWIIAIFDHVCPAGFTGFLSLTFYYSISLAAAIGSGKATKLILLCIGTILMAFAIYLNIYYPAPS